MKLYKQKQKHIRELSLGIFYNIPAAKQFLYFSHLNKTCSDKHFKRKPNACMCLYACMCPVKTRHAPVFGRGIDYLLFELHLMRQKLDV